MKAEGFIASRLGFKGKMAVITIAVSFLVMILAVCISDGFRTEIRDGISSITGDIILSSPAVSSGLTGSEPVGSKPSWLPELRKVAGVRHIRPAVYRAGIVMCADDIHGVIFKGTEADTVRLGVRIPSRLAARTGLAQGSDMVTYFIGDKTKIRKFTVTEVYDAILDSDDLLIVYASIKDMRRLCDWDEDQASLLEVSLDGKFRSRKALREKTAEIGSIASLCADGDEDILVATDMQERYARIFDWLDIIDFNVYAILALMTLVAGFNMISGLLILLIRSISTIGTLKALGMTDRAIARVFLRVAARIAGTGMAAGNALALLFCAVQGSTHILRLNPVNYFVSFVPVSVNLPAVLFWDAASFAVIMLMMLIPTLFISRIDPSLTVKTE